MTISLHYRVLLRLLALTLSLGAGSAHAESLAELYATTQNPPPTVTTALTWVKDGKIVQANILKLTEALAAERSKLTEMNGGTLPERPAGLPGKVAGESPEVNAAIRGYSDYLLRNSDKNDPRHLLGKRKRWLQMAYGRKQMDISEERKACAEPCSKTAKLDQQRDLELKTELRSWNALFDDWKQTRRKVILAADPLLTATNDGADASTPEGRALLVGYKAAMLDEIELLQSISELSLLRADAIVKGLDGSESDAITGATKKAK